ncbi:MAG: hypothetical protein RLN60_03550 [Phycisphaerales bacterium]
MQANQDKADSSCPLSLIPASWPLPLQFLLVLSPTLSLLSMFQDLTPVKLAAQLQTVVDAYQSLVDNTIGNLIGFFAIGWMEFTDIERHIFVVYAVIAGAGVRAFAKHAKQEHNNSPPPGKRLIQYTGSFLVGAVFLVLFPLAFNCYVFGLLLLFVAAPRLVVWLMNGLAAAEALKGKQYTGSYVKPVQFDGDEARPISNAVRQQLIWSLGGLLGVLILNAFIIALF